MRTIQLAAACVVMMVGISADAQASITAINPFSGDANESFESLLTGYPYQSNPLAIMGGAAEISSDYLYIYEPVGPHNFGLADSGMAQVSDGSRALGIDNFASTATILFNSSVREFGAYWGAATASWYPLSEEASVAVRFFDSGNQLIGSTDFLYRRPGDGVLEWHGWSIDGDVRYVTFTGDFVVLDGLQVNFVEEAVPEPATLAIWGFGAIGCAVAAYRRRKQSA
jgi:hypothetical protein